MRADFYVLPSAAESERTLFCCRLTEKAYQQGYQVYVLAAQEDTAAALDDKLWTYRQGSFIPHARSSEADGEPVLIGTAPPATTWDLLINLTEQLPADWQRHGRIAEIANQVPEILNAARQRYRAYREAGVTPGYHRLNEP